MLKAGAQTLFLGGAPLTGAAVYHQARGDFVRADRALALATAAREQVPDIFAPAPEQRAADLNRAAAAVPGLQEETVDLLSRASAAVPGLQRQQALAQAAGAAGALAEGQTARNANLLQQAASQAPALTGERAIVESEADAAATDQKRLQDDRNRNLLAQAAKQAPDLFGDIDILPPEIERREMPPPVTRARVAAVETRLGNVSEQLATTVDPARRADLIKEKAVLTHKVKSAADVALATETAARTKAAGAPATARALEATTVQHVSARDEAIHEAVDAVPSELFAEEEVSAPPRRGEAGFAPPAAGEVIGRRAEPAPEPVPAGPTLPTPAAAPTKLAEAVPEISIRPGIKGQEAVIQRPSTQIRTELQGQEVDVEVISTTGEKRIQKQPAAQALMDLKKDRTAFQLLSDCLNK